MCSEIIDNFLYLSGQDVANNLSILEENGITHIVNAAGEICDCTFPEKITYLRLNLRDNSNEVSSIYIIIDYFIIITRTLKVVFMNHINLLKKQERRMVESLFIVYKVFLDQLLLLSHI